MYRKTLAAAALGSLALLAACGGSSSNGNNGSGSGDDETSSTITAGEPVAGPLDDTQATLSASALAPLQESVADTPLEGVVQCVDAIVVQGALDYVDLILVALESSASDPASADPEAASEALSTVATQLTALLQALAGDPSACLGGGGEASPEDLDAVLAALEETPLAPVATALAPVLEEIFGALGSDNDGDGETGEDLQLSSVAAFYAQLNAAMQLALTQVPAEAYEAPVVGGALLTVATALEDIDSLLTAALVYDSATTAAALEVLLNDALVNVLTQVVPLAALEEMAGQEGALSEQVVAGAGDFSATVAEIAGQALTPTFELLLSEELAVLLDPIENDVLPTILMSISDILAGGGGGEDDGEGPLAGTPLAGVVDAVTAALQGLLGESEGSCLFTGVPLLEALCGE